MNTSRRSFLATSAAFAAMGPAAAAESPLDATRRWFKEAQFGLMAHWGLYSLLAGEWKGRKSSRYGEWIQSNLRIPNAEYHRLAAAFNPVLFDPLEWMKRARDAGMRYFVFTAKHHEGFAMFRSKASRFNVVDATPFGRDVVGEIAEACRATGVKLGLYYSQDLDWSERDGGGYRHRRTAIAGSSWCNDWDWPDAAAKDYTRYFEAKAKPQVKEILTQYGDLCLVWFDTPQTISPAQSRELVDMVRRYNPGCLVNSRIGNGLGDYTTPGDNELPSKSAGDKLFETPGTMNDSWGYSAGDTNFKTVERILAIKAHCRERGANYLLNMSPDGLGRIPAGCLKIFEGLRLAREGGPGKS